jgi:hypothetical protein
MTVRILTEIQLKFLQATGAGEGNRTLVCSLGSLVNVLKLLPRVPFAVTAVVATKR